MKNILKRKKTTPVHDLTQVQIMSEWRAENALQTEMSVALLRDTCISSATLDEESGAIRLVTEYGAVTMSGPEPEQAQHIVDACALDLQVGRSPRMFARTTPDLRVSVSLMTSEYSIHAIMDTVVPT